MNQLIWVPSQDATVTDVGAMRRQPETSSAADNSLFDEVLLSQYPVADSAGGETGKDLALIDGEPGGNAAQDGKVLPGGKTLPPDMIADQGADARRDGSSPEPGFAKGGLAARGKWIEPAPDASGPRDRRTGAGFAGTGDAEGALTGPKAGKEDGVLFQDLQAGQEPAMYPLQEQAGHVLSVAAETTGETSEMTGQDISVSGEGQQEGPSEPNATDAGGRGNARQKISLAGVEHGRAEEAAYSFGQGVVDRARPGGVKEDQGTIGPRESVAERPDAGGYEPAEDASLMGQPPLSGYPEPGIPVRDEGGGGKEVVSVSGRRLHSEWLPQPSIRPAHDDIGSGSETLAFSRDGMKNQGTEDDESVVRDVRVAVAEPGVHESEIVTSATPVAGKGENAGELDHAAEKPDAKPLPGPDQDSPGPRPGNYQPLQGVVTGMQPARDRDRAKAQAPAPSFAGARMAGDEGVKRFGSLDHAVPQPEHAGQPRRQEIQFPVRPVAPVPDPAVSGREDMSGAWQQTFRASLEAGQRLSDSISPAPSPHWSGLAPSPGQTGGDTAATTIQPRLEIPVGHRNWGHELGQRMLLLVDQKQQSAEIRLNPRQLGSIEIRLNMNHDQASVSIHAQHAAVREAVENALPRLREMFDQAGLNLARFDTSDSQQEGRDQPAWTDGHAEEADMPAAQAPDGMDAGASTMNASPLYATSLLDTYA